MFNPLVTSIPPAVLKPVSIFTKTPLPFFTTIIFLEVASGITALVGTTILLLAVAAAMETFTKEQD